MRFFRPWKNEGNFMLKNERLVRLHVRFENHSEAHSTDTGSDLFEKIGHSEAALGWKMACTKCEHDLASPLINSTKQHGAKSFGKLVSRPGSLFFQVALLFVLLLSNQSQTIAVQQNHDRRAPLAFAERRARVMVTLDPSRPGFRLGVCDCAQTAKRLRVGASFGLSPGLRVTAPRLFALS
jgi:hypothetical protein